jgi:hypothetical protein
MPLRHERRRRLVSDEPAGITGAESRQPIRVSARANAMEESPTKSYTDAAKRAGGRAVSTLVPSRLVTIGLAAVACLAMVAACAALHAVSDALATLVPGADVAALRLDQSGSFGHWLASMLLVVAGAVALFVFSLRRHRIDDYHGRYRVWIWIGAACLLASLVEATDLDRLARSLCGLAAGWISVRDDILWPAILGIIAAAVGLRLFFEIRRCRSAIGALAGGILSFLFATAADQGWPIAWNSASLPFWSCGSWLVGYVFVLTAFLLYARHVQLDVEGSLVVRNRRKRRAAESPHDADDRTEQPEAPRKPALRLRTDLDPLEAAAGNVAASSRSTPAKVMPPGGNSATDDGQQSTGHLSRAERRRLRREARMAS